MNNVIKKIEIKDEKETTVCHPETSELFFDIYKTYHQGRLCYYYDIDGDYYSNEWITDESPLEACKRDAMSDLESMYNGTYYSESVGERSERLTFSAMQEGR